MIGKEHAMLLRDLRRYIKYLNDGNIAVVDFFTESSYVDSKGETRPCFNITKRGCEFIANKLTGQKGTEFTARYVLRFNELEENSTTSLLIQSIQSLADAVNTSKTEMESRLSKLEETVTSPAQVLLPNNNKPYNPWFSKMHPKYTMLEEFYGVTRGCLYRNILYELENLYDLDTAQIKSDYCYETGKTDCYPLEPYEFNHKYRDLIEGIVNNALISNGIVSPNDPIATNKHITIFEKPQEENF